MSQNARVARWVPTVDPDSVGEGIISNSVPNPNNVILTKFALGGGGGGGVAFADDIEMKVGDETLKAVSPATYRDELVRLFTIPDADFANPVAIAVRAGSIADNNRLIKTDGTGRLDAGFLPPIIDGGEF